jgi:hypothetical protein
MSSLAARLAESKKPPVGPSCFFAVLLPKLDDVDRRALLNALDPDSGMQGEQIAAVLTSEGHPVRGHTVQWHRRGKCACDDRR